MQNETMTRLLIKKTMKARHRLARLLAPKLLKQYDMLNDYISKTPRPMILYAKEYFGKTVLKGVEIGVSVADNALSILKELAVAKLCLIDPYETHPEEFEVACKKLARFPQVVFVSKTSEEAAKELQTEQPFDFIYIDGDHSYEAVQKDLQLYYPLVKEKGLIGGHDYTPYLPSVVEAVNDYARKAKVELHINFPDWWVQR
jgi:hypothetical protein